MPSIGYRCLGIDEAGRGPVLGPMVYGIAYCPLAKQDVLKDLGCADSKQLTEEKRETIFQELTSAGTAKDTVGWSVHVIAPSTISQSMLRRSKHSLNEISMDAAIGLVRRAQDMNVNIAEVYVDTVGPPEKYQEKLQKIFPDYLITVAKKADSTYPIVSAASICAKVTRDHALKVWQFREADALNGLAFGSGYPGDPVTKAFLHDNIDPMFGYPRLVRFSWSTASTALEGRALDVVFDDTEDGQDNKPPPITSFFKAKDKNGVTKRGRAQYFKIRCLDNVTDL